MCLGLCGRARVGVQFSEMLLWGNESCQIEDDPTILNPSADVNERWNRPASRLCCVRDIFGAVYVIQSHNDNTQFLNKAFLTVTFAVPSTDVYNGCVTMDSLGNLNARNVAQLNPHLPQRWWLRLQRQPQLQRQPHPPQMSVLSSPLPQQRLFSERQFRSKSNTCRFKRSRIPLQPSPCFEHGQLPISGSGS